MSRPMVSLTSFYSDHWCSERNIVKIQVLEIKHIRPLPAEWTQCSHMNLEFYHGHDLSRPGSMFYVYK